MVLDDLRWSQKTRPVNYTLDAPVAYKITDTAHPIMKGMTDFTITDESFFLMTWSKSPEIHVLATAPQAPTQSAGSHAGEVVPQMWTYERTIPGGQPYRAFVWMQGHNYVNISPRTSAADVASCDRMGRQSSDRLASHRTHSAAWRPPWQPRRSSCRSGSARHSRGGCKHAARGHEVTRARGSVDVGGVPSPRFPK